MKFPKIYSTLLLLVSIHTMAQVSVDTLSIYKDALRFADSVGVRLLNEEKVLAKDSLLATRLDALLLKIHYGNAPFYLNHNALSQTIDSNLVRGWRQTGSWAKPAYNLLEQKLIALLPKQSAGDTLVWLKDRLNFERWRRRYPGALYAVVNVPSASMKVSDANDQIKMEMNVIVGKTLTPTPLMVTTFNQVVTYPYWNVPKSIATQEMLPKIKKNLGYIDAQQLQVFDRKGRAVDPYAIDWAKVTATNFSYRLRQASGCDNALGVMKFNLINPYDVYMHDTNQRHLFKNKNRWLSHGCIRLQKPVELANMIFGYERYPENFLDTCLLSQAPETESLPISLPLFVVYNLVDYNPTTDKVAYYGDVYKYYNKTK